MNTIKTTFAAAAAATLFLAAGASAQGFPTRPVTIVAPIAAGTAIDIVARLYAEQMAGILGQPVVVENHPGAGGSVGAQVVANAAPDGHTILAMNAGHYIVGALRDLPYDPVGGFQPLAMVAQTPVVIVVSATLGVSTLEEFVELARSQPGELSFGSAGQGSSTHLAGEYFNQQAGTEIEHVPYSQPNLLPDLVAGRIHAVFAPPAYSLQLVNSGDLVALAVGAGEPMTAPMELPTAASAGIDYEYYSWYGFLAPAGTPEAAMTALNDAIVGASNDSAIQGTISSQGLVLTLVSLDDFEARIGAEMARLEPALEIMRQQMN